MEKIRERDSSLDFACGIFIIFGIIFGHAEMLLENGRSDLSNASHPLRLIGVIQEYLFFVMPWFFYKAGMFAKIFRKKNEFKPYFLGSVQRLLIPYVFFSIIGHMFYCIELVIQHQISFHKIFIFPIKQIICISSISGNLPLWFLLALFFVRMSYTLLKYIGTHDLEIAAIGFIIAFGFHFFNIHKPLIITQTALGLSFFAWGHFLKEKQYKIEMPYITIFLALFFLNMILLHCFVDFRDNGSKANNESYLLFYIISILSIIIFNNWAKFFHWEGLSWITTIGQDSMTYYCVHWIVIIIVRTISVDMYHIDSYVSFCILICTFIAVLPTINYLLKKQHWLRL